ncbi:MULTISPECIES: sensor domain-containing diguanylate cyclase [Stenotrophomonas]|nr:sensor domain-containing diguanylate cyclase [Stenotrophomonas maltophilia]
MDIENVLFPACLANASGLILFVNAPFRSLVAGRTLRGNIFDYCRRDVHRARELSLERFKEQRLDIVLYGIPYSAAVYAIATGGEPAFLLSFNRRGSGRGNLEATLTSVLQYSLDCVKLIRADGVLEYMNHAGCSALGVDERQLALGLAWTDLLPPDVRVHAQRALADALNGYSVSFPGRNERPDGTTVYWSNLVCPIDDVITGERKAVCISRDITEVALAREQLKLISETDDLTGLFNRRHFHAVAEHWFSLPQGATGWLLLIDLDGFKAINDRLGHLAGDDILRVFASRLREQLRCPELFAARLGGDEFAILHQSGDQVCRTCEPAAIVSRLSSPPFAVEGRAVHVGVSGGYVLLPEGAQTLRDALSHADTALRSAKRSGKGRCLCFTAS